MQIQKPVIEKYSFGSHLRQQHIISIAKASPRKIEKYFEAKGIYADFSGKKMIAKMCQYTAEIFEHLGLQLPKRLYVTNIPKKQEAMALTVYGVEQLHRKTVRTGTMFFDRGSFSEKTKKFNSSMTARRKTLGSGHFLNIVIHEFMHNVLFLDMEKKLRYLHRDDDKLINSITRIDIKPFKQEIKNKLGSYGTADCIELHALYWAKEICKALDSNYVPRYNPIKTPKIQLSEQLRNFIDAISKSDIKSARKIAKEAKKLQDR